MLGRPASLPRHGQTSAVAPTRVDVWSDLVDARRGETAGWLDADERARAGRFRFQRDRDRFVARRLFLRRVLAGYLDVAPGAIRYRTTGTGRPELDPPSTLSFSASHSDGLAIVAVSRDRLVGVDVEHLRSIPEAADIARSLFTEREHGDLLAAPIDERSAAFLRLWTRKEAYAKALGAGVSLPFDAFEVLGGAGDASTVVAGPAGGGSLVLAGLEVPPGFVGCVAASGTELRLEHVSLAGVAS